MKKIIAAILLSLILTIAACPRDAIAFNNQATKQPQSYVVEIQPDHIYLVRAGSVQTGLKELGDRFEIVSVQPIYDKSYSSLALDFLIVFVKNT